MTSIPYTPGPWQVVNRSDITGAPDLSVQVADPRSKQVGSKQVVRWDKPYPSDTDHANAHLIAAAPDLLAACEMFMGHLQTGFLVRDISKDGQSGFAMSMMSFMGELQKAQAAITKAKSKTDELAEGTP